MKNKWVMDWWVNNQSVILTLEMPLQDGSDPRGAAPAIKSEEPTTQPPPGLDIPQHYMHPLSNAMARPNPYKPTHRITGKPPPPIVVQLDESSINKELQLENNEDKLEKKTLMDNIQLQPWWQYEDDVSKYTVKDIEIGMIK
eukprot:4585980-Amphidinium_carterae.5